MRTKKLGLLQRIALVFGIGGASFFGNSCTSSGIERAIEQIVNNDQPFPGVYVPNYPPYVPDEPLPSGNSPHPQRVVEWDDVDNKDELIDQSCTDSGYTTIRSSSNLNAVPNGLIAEYDHELKDGGGDDIRLIIINDGNHFDFEVSLVITGQALFKNIIGWKRIVS